MADFFSASHDVVFKALFVRNPYLLRGFLSDTLDLGLTNADSIEILNPEMIPDRSDGKTSRLDLRVRTPNRKYNVEMQARRDGFAPVRVLHYWSRLFGSDIKAGESYENLSVTYSVNVLGFEYFNCESCYSTFEILEKRRYELFAKELSIHIFELPKIARDRELSDRVLDWLRIIQADKEETLKMIGEKTDNPMIREAAGAILELNADEKLRQQIFDRQSAINDYNSDMTRSRAEGFMEGKKDTANKLYQAGWTVEQIAELLDVAAVDVKIWLNDQ